ncbi:MAG: hypothetical protein UY13_C0002G0257 [Candidatus Pacebacteria bacterium GW2011_GWB1_47_8]|nr:MAG: hypothetical protein UX28_C0001G0405 [Candidatus Pacebacteria bacterium GW2011_GWA1_46_10]KKU84345.1 MAG: hypothetical protein UY13_C0002G0257 [Candidatus Pacebacteria bacterium GW2011_GWB1_47_8]HCR81229.1 hypothetical protein [Candidatus Paceibacterota bacterium]
MTIQAEYTIAFVAGRLARRDFRAGDVEYPENNTPQRQSFSGTITDTTIDLYESGVGQIRGTGTSGSWPQITATGYIDDFSLRIESSSTFSGQIGSESFRGRVDGYTVKLDGSTNVFTLR